MKLPASVPDVGVSTILEVAEMARKAYPPGKALILTGSAARGEATIAVTPAGEQWLSDLEFLVVAGDSAGLREQERSLDCFAVEIGRLLTAGGVKVAVELTLVSEAYFAAIRPHLFGYELRECGQQLFGDEDYLALIPRFHWTEIPREDAWRLVSNRMVEWLSYLVEPPGRLSLAEQFYIVVKLYLDLATSISLFSGHYAPGYKARADALDPIGQWLHRNRLDSEAKRLIPAARISTDFKLAPRSRFGALWESDAHDLPSALEELGYRWLYDQLPETLSAVWNWEASHIGSGNVEYAVGLGRIYGLNDRARGWAKLLLDSNGQARWSALRRVPRLFFNGTPRSLVYHCTSRLLSALGSRSPGVLRDVRRHLPVIFGDCDDGWVELGGQCVKAWRMFLRRSRL